MSYSTAGATTSQWSQDGRADLSSGAALASDVDGAVEAYQRACRSALNTSVRRWTLSDTA